MKIHILLIVAVAALSSWADEFIIGQGEEWIPLANFRNIREGSALDFSGQDYFHRPAGKFGRVIARGGHFELEKRPGLVQRFYGVNLCETACFPDHALADEVAVRLARTGYNSVRIHHYDAPVTTAENGRTVLDPAAMERLDYLLAALIRNGLYIETDLFVSRQPVPWRDLGIPVDGESERYAQKALMTFYPPAYTNWCAFARAFLTHVNPYTGRSLADEPALACLTLVNEGRFVYPYHKLPKIKAFQKRWRAWIAEKRRTDPGCYPGFASTNEYPKIEWRDQKGNIPQAVADFSSDLERDFVTRAKAFLRDELKCRALVSNQNNAAPYAPLNAAREETYDFTDTHYYRGTPESTAKGTKKPPFDYGRDNLFKPDLDAFTRDPFLRLADKPFVVTELNFPPPNPYRGAGGLKVGALSALQDFGGIWRFAYAQSERNLKEGKFSETRFDLCTDPVGLASDRFALMLFLRGDLKPLADSLTLVMDPASLNPPSGPALEMAPPWSNDVWRVRFGSALPATAPKGARTVSLRAAHAMPACPLVSAGSREATFDGERGSLVVDTPRTAGGFVPHGILTTSSLVADAGETPVTVWVSALDGQPIGSSRRLLLTRLVDQQYDGARYTDAERSLLISKGQTAVPIVRAVTTPVRVKVKNPATTKVYALDTTGRPTGEIAAAAKGGWLVFDFQTKGPDGKAVLSCELVEENR